MDSGVSAGEVGGVFAGLVALLAALGKAGQWLINWKDARENSRAARLAAWEASLDRREQEHREQTVRELHAVNKKLSAVAGALFEALAELQRIEPANPMLVRAKLILREVYPVSPEMPDEMKAFVRRPEFDREESAHG